MDAVGWTLWREAASLGVGHGEAFAARVARELEGVTSDALEPMADRALALHHAGLHARVEVALVLFGAAREREGRSLPERFHRALVAKADLARYVGLLPLAGRALRLVPDAMLSSLDDAPCPPIDLLGHVGGAERARRFVAEVRDWPKGAYGALKKARDKRTFERAYGYSAAEHEAHWIEGLSAFGADAIAPILEAIASGSAQSALLYVVLGRVGGADAANAIGEGLARSSAADRKAALRGFEALGGDDARHALEHARGLARGAAAKALAALTLPEASMSIEDLRASEGRAWASREVSLETLRAVGTWWVEHVASDAWYSPRPAYAEALAAHASLDGALEVALDTLSRVERSGATTLDALVSGFGRERVLPHLYELLREGRLRRAANEEVLRALHYSTGVPPYAAFGAAGGSAMAGELALRALLAASELELEPVVEALRARDPAVRRLAARVIEVRSIAEAAEAIDEALAREKAAAARMVLLRTQLALAVTRGSRTIASALERFEDGATEGSLVMPTSPLCWASGSELSLAERRGLVGALEAEDELGPSPLAQRAARALDESSAEVWAAAWWIEKPNLSRRVDAARTFAAFALSSEAELTRRVARVRRRTSTTLYAWLPTLLARRDTPAARRALEGLGGR